ncbi:unnamed protein product [Clavelina lepadiformis]|uniref:J domain-containing protein n=1 Tax=Clavelina lepadiformis TaxID=159417 RepID=A0ABP0FXW7_CLALP
MTSMLSSRLIHGIPLLTRISSFAHIFRRWNHYKTLGVLPSATYVEIKAAYIELSKVHHPDVQAQPGQTNNTNADDFIKVKEAFEVLSNPRTRKEYDLKNYGRSSELNRFSTGEYELYQQKPASSRSKPQQDKEEMEEKVSLFSVSPRVRRLLHYLYGVIVASGVLIYFLGSRLKSKAKKDNG